MATGMTPQPDRDSEGWWNALARRELLLQQCTACEQYRWPPRASCSGCGAFTARWSAPCEHATVASWTVTHPRPGPTSPAPFVVLLVRLDPQPDILIPGFWAGESDGSDLTIGMRVRVDFEAPTDTPLESTSDHLLLRWTT